MDEWQKICDQYGSLVWATVYRILSDENEALDCCQDVFSEAWRRADREPVEDWARLLRWLAVRRAIDRLRQQRRDKKLLLELRKGAVVADGSPGPVEAAELNELMERVRSELVRLPQRQAEVVWLRCVEERTYAEIAAEMGVDTNSVGVILHRAKTQLRKVLADLHPNPST